MGIEDIVSVVISAATVTPTRPGFGTPMIVAAHSNFPERSREYRRPSDLLDDGFTVDDAAYKMAVAIKSQDPSVKKFKVGRRALAFTESYTLEVLEDDAGTTYLFSVDGTEISYEVTDGGSYVHGGGTITVTTSDDSFNRNNGSWIDDGFKVGDSLTTSGFAQSGNNTTTVVTAVTALKLSVSADLTDEGPTAGSGFTLTSVETVSTIANAIAALIDAISSVTASDSGAVITVTAASTNHVIQLEGWETRKLEVKNTTSDPGIQTDLAAIFAADTDWYGFGIDSQSEAQINEAAEWAEANKKLFGADSGDTLILDAGTTTDVASDLEGQSYDYTYLLYNGSDTHDYRALAWMGNRFSSTPGSDTWMFKTLKGVEADVLTPSEYSAAEGKKCNLYLGTAGVDITYFGKVSSGEFIDVIRFIDWLTAEIQIRVFQALAANPKIPYTDAGVDIIKGIIHAVLQDGIKAGGLDGAVKPEVSAPLVADVDPIDKGNRLLPDVEFTARLAGAIHSTDINGVVTL